MCTLYGECKVAYLYMNMVLHRCTTLAVILGELSLKLFKNSIFFKKITKNWKNLKFQRKVKISLKIPHKAAKRTKAPFDYAGCTAMQWTTQKIGFKPKDSKGDAAQKKLYKKALVEFQSHVNLKSFFISLSHNLCSSAQYTRRKREEKKKKSESFFFCQR